MMSHVASAFARKSCLALFGLMLFVSIARPTFATPNHLICDLVARQASSESGVPLGVLLAITRTETGRTKSGKTTPWPWTVNMEGKGVWFDTEDAARAFVFSHFKAGARSFDVGCFQINYKWHGGAFRSIDEMFDPLENARYAAKFLMKLKGELGTWPETAGAYHSRTPEYASKYKKRFNKFHAQIGEAEAQIAAELPKPRRNQKTPRVNTYPLFQAGNESGLGSLFPSGAAGASGLIRDTRG